MAGLPLKVLIADDSALMRQSLRRLLEEDPDFEVVGMARDGEDAVQKARELRPDVMSMDINMPKLDGVTALQMVITEGICPVVMVSSLTQKSAAVTFECLELGAFDVVPKPDGTVSSNIAIVGNELRDKLKAAVRSGCIRRSQARRRREEKRVTSSSATHATLPFHAIAIGISTGGPATIMDVLPALPADLNAAVFLVQHMPATFLHTFVRRLDECCAMRVVEAQSGMAVTAGTCYVGSGGHHIGLLQKLAGHVVVRTPVHPPTQFVPSVDVMMKAVLQVYGARTIGVLMTGIGDDGANQMLAIRRAGGHTIAESEESCVVFGMPRQAIERGAVQVVAPSTRIAHEILSYLRGQA